jgi:hypothetical protein
MVIFFNLYSNLIEFEESKIEFLIPKINSSLLTLTGNQYSDDCLILLLQNYFDNGECLVNYGLVEQLLNNGINVNYKDNNNENALFFVTISFNFF